MGARLVLSSQPRQHSLPVREKGIVMVPSRTEIMVESSWAEVIKDAVIGILLLVFGALIGAVASAFRKVSPETMKERFEEYDKLVIQPMQREISKLEENSKHYVRQQDLAEKIATVNEKIKDVQAAVNEIREKVETLPALMEEVRRMLRRANPD